MVHDPSKKWLGRLTYKKKSKDIAADLFKPEEVGPKVGHKRVDLNTDRMIPLIEFYTLSGSAN